MKIIYERPPNFDVLNAKFKIAGKPVIFSWGDRIYNPERVSIPKPIIEHEEVHGQRQIVFLDKIDSEIQIDTETAVWAWWNQYMVDKTFRFNEELAAHKVEYRSFCKRHRGGGAQRKYLEMCADRLSSPLYGSIVTREQAISRIIGG